MFNRAKFRAKIIEKGFTIEAVANELKINKATLYRKMNGNSDFYRNEIQQLCNLLDIQNPNEIFFA